MPEATTTYEKLLEAQNEQLREAIEKLVVENDVKQELISTTKAQYNTLMLDVAKLLKCLRPTLEMITERRGKSDTPQVTWSFRWYPSQSIDNVSMPLLHPLLKKAWLDHLEGSVGGMKLATRNDTNGAYSYIPKPTAFPTHAESSKVTPT
jgi:hypothetical protein